ncbi:MAG: DUF1902 domain-containing protein [Oscillospiraceae bacterium]|nr:DUF1902 domain-containing protein [Oscillospiraceae bacterium]
MRCTVKFIWDNEAMVWYTETDDIPGLVLHAPSFDELIERVRLVSPDLLEDNLNYAGPVHISFECERIEEAIAKSQAAVAV